MTENEKIVYNELKRLHLIYGGRFPSIDESFSTILLDDWDNTYDNNIDGWVIDGKLLTEWDSFCWENKFTSEFYKMLDNE